MKQNTKNGGFALIALLLGVFVIGLIMAIRASVAGPDGKTRNERDMQAIREAETVKMMLEKRADETKSY